jgi:hypothetical protein
MTATDGVPEDLALELAPFFLLPPERAPRPWNLCLADAFSPADLFEEEGHSGNGYSWDAIARSVMAARGIDATTVTFDSEAGTFVAECPHRDVLLALGRALVALLRDPEALRDAIGSVPEGDWDD